MSNLRAVIQRVRRKQADKSDWLYIAGRAQDLSLEIDADLGCPDFDDETDEETEPAGFLDRGLRSTIDLGTVEQCIKWADRLASTTDENAVLVVIRILI